MKVKTIKVAGKPNQTTWAQVHVFLPEGEEKQQSHGQLIAALSFKAKNEEVEVSSFGSEIINRLQEIYYSNESEGILKKGEQSLESLAAEFLPQVELEAVVGVVWARKASPRAETYFYAVRNGEGQAVICREGKRVKLFEGEMTKVSGEIKGGDKLLIGTKQLLEIIGEEEWGQGELEQASESLGALVYNQEHSSQTAGVLIEVEKEEENKVEAEAEEAEVEVEVEKKTSKVGEWIKTGKGLVANLLKRKPQVRMRLDNRGRKSAFTAALILILIFSVSLVIAGGKKQKQKQEQAVLSVIEEVRYKYDEAHNLLKLNPLRAKSLLTSSKERIEEYKNSKGELPKELVEWLAKIEADLGSVQREYVVDSAAEWFDFDMVKDGFRGSDWEVDENKAIVWDEATKTIVELDLSSKASRIVLGGDKLTSGQLIGLTGDRGFVVETKNNPLTTVVDTKKGELVAEVAGEEWKNVSEAVGFGSNLYLLDKSSGGQIWKYLGVTSGLSAKKSYLNGDSYDLSEAVSMAIDGSVWVLFSDGTIAKYVQGVKDAFVVAGLDKPFEEPLKIYTSPEVKNIYVMDRRQTRVVEIAKTGEYVSQYVWPGIAGVKDLIVSETEKKIFMMTGEKVFVIDLKD